ncbi:uncharacterized protein K460DRAFT_161176 [Cucurbitaria berberidis CBS 394.84]|uniref:CCHC-type domain-containing protein n=1 Tax=Cucurbitaria berberidis CBS 394.84 TaxID=1168544 RepID=A0A9P4L7E8_9PLEO|nr:uncharacterized protein K460DRAFT_161176 [Cucurbitaria berberidis CBS 394.84]KAF1844252.1 hypothetical protein K460DRAFT_161176 [Cucurbitaria berberidis CBS 394.84]
MRSDTTTPSTMPTIQYIPSSVNGATWEFCRYCKKVGHHFHDCKNLKKVLCFRCERRDHFHDDCAEEIRDGNPRFDKVPETIQEFLVQRDAWQTRCAIMFELLKENGFEAAAVDLRDRSPLFFHGPKTLDEALNQRKAWRTHCTTIFRTIKDHGIQGGATDAITTAYLY